MKLLMLLFFIFALNPDTALSQPVEILPIMKCRGFDRQELLYTITVDKILNTNSYHVAIRPHCVNCGDSESSEQITSGNPRPQFFITKTPELSETRMSFNSALHSLIVDRPLIQPSIDGEIEPTIDSNGSYALGRKRPIQLNCQIQMRISK